MKVKSLLVLALALVALAYQTASALKIEGGTLQDVVVVYVDSSDSTPTTRLRDGWYAEGPRSIDINKDGDIYLLDWLGARVQKYDHEGNWILNLPLVSPGNRDPKRLVGYWDIAVDNQGNIYVTATRLVRKYSSEGGLLYTVPDWTELMREAVRKGESVHLPTLFARGVVDQTGRFYNLGGYKVKSTTILIFSPQLERKAELNPRDGYYDVGVVQKAAGDDIYFREHKYLLRTNLEDFLEAQKVDTVAVLPDGLRWYKYADYKVRESSWEERPVTLIGFDNDTCFYSYTVQSLHGVRDLGICLELLISKDCLRGGQLDYVGTTTIWFQRGTDECSDKELFDFSKQFIVSGDGTIYFLHGTVDTVKVSKIIME